MTDEFAELKSLVEDLRVSLPPLKEHQTQLVGLYMLAALRLGRGQVETFRDCIDGFYALGVKDDAPALRIIK